MNTFYVLIIVFVTGMPPIRDYVEYAEDSVSCSLSMQYYVRMFPETIGYARCIKSSLLSEIPPETQYESIEQHLVKDSE